MSLHAIAQAGLVRRERADVVADGDGVRLNRETWQRPQPSFREDVIQQNGINSPEHQIAVGVHVVVVRNRLDTVVPLGPQKNLVRDRSAERADLASPQIRERAEARHVGCPYAQDFAELVVGNRQRQRRPARQRVLHAAQADVRIAPGDGLVDRREHDLNELRRAPEAAREQVSDLDVETHLPVRVRGIGLDKRRTALGIARPAEHRRLGGRRRSRQAQQYDQARDART